MKKNNLDWYYNIKKLQELPLLLSYIPHPENKIYKEVGIFTGKIGYDYYNIENILRYKNRITQRIYKIPYGIKKFYKHNGSVYDLDYIIKLVENTFNVDFISWYKSPQKEEIKDFISYMPNLVRDIFYMLEDPTKLFNFITKNFQYYQSHINIDFLKKINNNFEIMYGLYNEGHIEYVWKYWKITGEKLKNDKIFLSEISQIERLENTEFEKFIKELL